MIGAALGTVRGLLVPELGLELLAVAEDITIIAFHKYDLEFVIPVI